MFILYLPCFVKRKKQKGNERYDNAGTVTLRFTDCSERFTIRNKGNMNL